MTATPNFTIRYFAGTIRPQAATEHRLQCATEILGVDPGSAEGLLAAMARELVQETVISGLGSSLDKT
ncbi:hypothetical protein RYZ20_06500 [Thioclava sp. A2]|nr:hypothetical protein [Thioclava sp. A2]MDV7270546.1 hypothetical protein [Thioclava sp. A2]